MPKVSVNKRTGVVTTVYKKDEYDKMVSDLFGIDDASQSAFRKIFDNFRNDPKGTEGAK